MLRLVAHEWSAQLAGTEMLISRCPVQTSLQWHRGPVNYQLLLMSPLLPQLATLCWFWMCLFAPFRGWQWLISSSCSTSVSHPDLLTLLCLPIWVTWKTAHTCVLGSWWPANPAANSTCHSYNPSPTVYSSWCFCSRTYPFALLRY